MDGYYYKDCRHPGYKENMLESFRDEMKEDGGALETGGDRESSKYWKQRNFTYIKSDMFLEPVAPGDYMVPSKADGGVPNKEVRESTVGDDIRGMDEKGLVEGGRRETGKTERERKRCPSSKRKSKERKHTKKGSVEGRKTAETCQNRPDLKDYGDMSDMENFRTKYMDFNEMPDIDVEQMEQIGLKEQKKRTKILEKKSQRKSIENKKSIRTNAATLLKEAAIILKEEEEENRKLLNLLVGSSNFLDYERMIEERIEEEKELFKLKIEKLHLEGRLTEQAGILAKLRLVEQSKVRRREFEKEREQLLEDMKQFKEAEKDKIVNLVTKVREINEKVASQKNKMITQKRQEVESLRRELQMSLREAMAKRREELDKKVMLIREVRAFEALKRSLQEKRPGRREEMEGTKSGFLGDMTLGELKARMGQMQQRLKEERLRRREKIRTRRARREALLDRAETLIRGWRERRRSRYQAPSPHLSPLDDVHWDSMFLAKEEEGTRNIGTLMMQGNDELAREWGKAREVDESKCTLLVRPDPLEGRYSKTTFHRFSHSYSLRKIRRVEKGNEFLKTDVTRDEIAHLKAKIFKAMKDIKKKKEKDGYEEEPLEFRRQERTSLPRDSFLFPDDAAPILCPTRNYQLNVPYDYCKIPILEEEDQQIKEFVLQSSFTDPTRTNLWMTEGELRKEIKSKSEKYDVEAEKGYHSSKFHKEDQVEIRPWQLSNKRFSARKSSKKSKKRYTDHFLASRYSLLRNKYGEPAMTLKESREEGPKWKWVGAVIEPGRCVVREGGTAADELVAARWDGSPEGLSALQIPWQPLSARPTCVRSTLARPYQDPVALLLRYWEDCPHGGRPASSSLQ